MPCVIVQDYRRLEHNVKQTPWHSFENMFGEMKQFGSEVKGVYGAVRRMQPGLLAR